ATLAIGAVLGFVAASGRVNPFQAADAAPKSSGAPQTEHLQPTASSASSALCCIEGACRDSFLVNADVPNRVADAAKKQNGKKPNILIIWGDDIGWFNPSCYHGGVMGYQTPNIDRIAREGVKFTDWYGQQSCTAGRAAFITGQSPIRTGLTKVGLPG